MKTQNAIYREAFKQFVFIVFAVILGRYSKGAFIAVLAFAGCWAALTNKLGFALSMFFFIPSLVIVNSIILPKSGALMSLSLRFGPLMIGLCLAISSCRRVGRYRLPLGLLFAYLGCATLSSACGYFPSISYMKIVNFAIFVIGVWQGTRNLQNHPQELFKLRAFLFALVVMYVYGSIAVYPFPGISTLNGVRLVEGLEGVGVGVEEANYLMGEAAGGQLFCGITYQSQTLSGVLACCFCWLVCDMLLIEQRFRWQHMAVIGVMPVLIFLTRSRMGLLVLSVFSVLMFVYLLHRIRLSPYVKRRISNVVMIGGVVMIIGMGVAEVRNNAISRWIRKVDDVESDNRSLSEAVTSSRMGLIESNLHDFKRNPLLGSGFQVAEWHQTAFANRKGLILSAPIEKGLLPVMVLGETGILGTLVFWVFVLVFCQTCAQNRFYATLTLFWVLFATNMGEATFFSPGGPGGVEWMMTIVGGFVIDMNLHAQRLRAMRWGYSSGL